MKHISILVSILLLARLCGNNQQVPRLVPAEPLSEEHLQEREVTEGTDSAEETPESLYYKEAVWGDNAWNDTVHVFHFWKELDEGEYLFDEPSPGQIAKWKKLCEDRNHQEQAGFPDRYLNMNQYMTLWDIVEMWYRDDAPPKDDDFILWRLAQYETMYKYLDSEYDRFYYLKNYIQGLCLFDDQFQFEMNIRAGLIADFQEFYDRIMVRDAIRHSPPRLAAALKEEEKAWQNYHKEVSAAYHVIDGANSMASAWPMAICGILEDNAKMRETSLEDFYFALTDSLDYSVTRWKSFIDSYEIVKHQTVPAEKVLAEYRLFLDSMEEEDEEYYPPLAERRKALAKESEAWKKWMQKRQKVSSLLTGLCKETYDNATNNVRRYKLIMLKNRYEGYGITSGDVMDCLISYSASDEELNGPPFD